MTVQTEKPVQQHAFALSAPDPKTITALSVANVFRSALCTKKKYAVNSQNRHMSAMDVINAENVLSKRLSIKLTIPRKSIS